MAGKNLTTSIASYRPLDEPSAAGADSVDVATASDPTAFTAIAPEDDVTATVDQTPSRIPETVDDAVTEPRVPAVVEPTLAEDASAPIKDENRNELVAADTEPVIESLQMLASPENTLPLCTDGTCQQKANSLGTTLHWADSPSDAYRIAGEQHKLVFLIHVSGNFEIPGFT